ncbi:MAG: tRNA pseudouridine(13) synthase TruD [Phycisphaerales bacterium]
MSLPAQLLDPLPQVYVTSTPGIGGSLKQRPDDFLVNELPLYEPCGEGEHLYLRIQKRGLSHGELMRALCRYFRVKENRIGFAGMKDKHAVTSQLFSIHTPQDCAPDAEIHRNARIEWVDRHANKLRLGHLQGNRFSIRVRDVDPMAAPQAEAIVRALTEYGVPNFFGSQRFGYRRNNHILGGLLLARDWQGYLDELLGPQGSAFPEFQRERRALYEQGELRESYAQWAPADHAERAALRGLHETGSDRRAVLAIGRRGLSFSINALQSAVFNHLLAQRIAAGTLNQIEPGDLAWKHDSRAVFAVDEEAAASAVEQHRIRQRETSPSGPLFGSGMTAAAGVVLERELAALAAFGLSPKDFDDLPTRVDGARRPFRTMITHPEVDSGVDEHGPYVRVAFDLERGSYATVVLREIMKIDGASDDEE